MVNISAQLSSKTLNAIFFTPKSFMSYQTTMSYRVMLELWINCGSLFYSLPCGSKLALASHFPCRGFTAKVDISTEITSYNVWRLMRWISLLFICQWSSCQTFVKKCHILKMASNSQVLKFQTLQKSIKAFPGYIKDVSSNKLLFGCFQIGVLKL